MGLKSALSLVTRRIGEAVKKAADDHGLLPGDYALAGTFNGNSERIYLVFGTDKKVSDDNLYGDILAEIGRKLPEFPHFTSHVGLVIQQYQNLDQIYLDAVGDGKDELDLSERFEAILARRDA